MSDAAEPPKPLPNGIVPHPADFVIRLDIMQPAGVHAGYLRIRAVDGAVETFGFDTTDATSWAAIEKFNPGVVKLCRNQFELERRATHTRRELLNAQEAAIRGLEVLGGKRPAVT